MRVRCVRHVATTGRPEPSSSSLTIGTEYVVLEVTVSPSAEGVRILYRIEVDRDGVPALFHADNFEIVDGGLPQNWRLWAGPNGHLELGPGRWQRQGFWEDYFGQEPDALDAYEREKVDADSSILRGRRPSDR